MISWVNLCASGLSFNTVYKTSWQLQQVSHAVLKTGRIL